MKNILLPVLFLTGMSVMNSRFGFQGRDILNVSQPNVEKMQPHQEFAKWIEKKNKENALKLLTPEATNLTTSSQTLNAEQQKQFEKATSNLVFIENKGQWHNDVLYLCRMGGLDAWITKYGVSYNFYKCEEIASSFVRQKPQSKVNFDHLEKEYRLIGHGIVFKHHNHNTYINREGLQKQEGYYNYFIGNDPTKHATNVALYKEAIVKNVYNGIDLRYYFDRGFLRYDYIVYPGADPSQITFSIQGSDNIYLNAKGDLVFTTRFGEVAVSELKTYQAKNKKEVANKFIKKGFAWGISLGSYDASQPLIIDPLIYSTYIGGSLNDIGRDIALDVNGNAYLTGWTGSANFPITLGAYQTTKGTGEDVFVTKLNAAGNGMVYSTFLGGNGDEKGFGIAIDGSGNAYVSGETSSNNFPTQSAYQSNFGGVVDAFITKLNASGNALLYSTFLGGSSDEGARRIAVDGSGNAYISGYSQSNNFPTTAGAYQTIKSGGYDAFVTKINTAGNSLGYSTFLGGNEVDASQAIAIDGNSNAYVTGRTASNNFPTTSGAYQTINDGSFDVFVTKLNASGSGLLYSTYIGGNADEEAFGIAVDGSGSAYVTGETVSTNYDVTTGAFQTTIGGGDDVFVTKLNASGSGLVYSTYIGGSGGDGGYGIAVDGSGNAYVTGRTVSTDYDVTPGAFQTTYGGGTNDVFVTKLNASGSGLVYSTYIGGSGADLGYGIAVDGSGNAYVTGMTNSGDYDVTAGAFQTTYGGNYDVFVTKLCLMRIALSSAPSTTNQTVCINTAITNITYTSTGATGATFSGLPTGVTGNYSSGDITISGTPTDTGTFTYSVTLTGGCGTSTATGTITVTLNNTITLSSSSGTDNQTVCINNAITNITYSSSGATGATFSGLPTGVTGNYSGGNITISGTPTVSGTFTYTVTLTGGCDTTTATGTITVTPNNTITLSSASGTDNQTVCINTAITNITYSSTGAAGATFSGLPTGVTGNYSGGNITISGTPTVSGTFNYTVTLTGGCGSVSTTGTISIGCVGIEETANNVFWSIFPNPTSGIFTIQSEKGGVFEVLDITGRMLHTCTTKNQTETIRTNLPAGIYFIREKESRATQKLIVE